MTTMWLCGVIVPDASEHQEGMHCNGHPVTRDGVHSFVNFGLWPAGK